MSLSLHLPLQCYLLMYNPHYSGRVALLQVDAEPEPQQASAWRLVSMLPDSMAGTGGHSDIVRAVAWDAAVSSSPFSLFSFLKLS